MDVVIVKIMEPAYLQINLPVAVCSFLTSAKYMEKQQRGLFGVGLKMVAAFSTKDTDFPIKVWNKSIEES